MDDKPHKSHRPAHSGGKADKKDKTKGKEKVQGFNEKVCIVYRLHTASDLLVRRLLLNLVDVQTDKDVATLSVTKPVSMSLL